MMVPGLLAFLATAAPPRDFAEERMLLDRRLETLRRILPDGPSPLADVSHVRQLAETAKVLRVEVAARAPLESGARGDVPMDVVGFGRFVEVDRFFRSVALSPRLLDVESVTLTATPEDVIKMAAVVRAPFGPLR
ncbi:MAG TPA: type 4a pilus biogenesis protein PilO, partial [Vicinamibacteria bacterium]